MNESSLQKALSAYVAEKMPGREKLQKALALHEAEAHGYSVEIDEGGSCFVRFGKDYSSTLYVEDIQELLEHVDSFSRVVAWDIGYDSGYEDGFVIGVDNGSP